MAVIDTSHSSQLAKGFVGSLFDFSFQSFITPKLIRVLYLLGLLLGVLFAIGAIVAAFGVNSWLGLLALVFSPVVFLLTLTYSRVTLELIAIVFRLEEHASFLRRLP